jgi:hypothetical protein
MAFFSDPEEFANNQLVAGELDLLVDWEEHYSDWSPDESDGLQFDPVMDLSDIPTTNPNGLTPDPTDPNSWIPFPPGFDDLLYVWARDVSQFMDNTAIDAYPDSDDDGVQDTIKARQQVRSDNSFLPEAEIERIYRDQFADVPDDLQGRRPLIELTDVKPGDFGEVTFSVHLFDNPGYIWLTGGIDTIDENGTSEPEAADEDEQDGVVELLDEIRVAVWHDDGNNLLDVLRGREVVVHEKPINGPDADENLEIPIDQAIILQGTLRDLLETLSTGNGVPLDADPTTADRDCFPNSTTRYFAFAWWLPVDHANEIQTDSVTFDLGFYTEQCRHNDGSGMDATMPSAVTVTADDSTESVSTSHRIEVSVGNDVAGDTLNELVVDYPNDFDISNVGEEDVFNEGVEQSGGGAVSANTTNADGSDNGTRLTLTFGSPLAGLSTGDTIFVEYDDVQNASTAGTYDVAVSVNGTAVGSDSLDIV